MAGTFIVEFSTNTGCNLGCKYCYSRHINKKLTPFAVDKFLEPNKGIYKLLEIYNKDDYHISYFGGEPLLNWDIIRYSLPKFYNDPKCSSVVVITNGLLLDKEKLDFLKKYNCGISLSFDGIWQNYTRPLANGEDSLKKYIQNKDLFNSILSGCKVMLDPKFFHLLTENYQFFVDEYNFNFPDFSLIRDDIYTPEDIKTFDKEITRLADKVIEYNKAGKISNVGLFTLYLSDTLAGSMFGKRTHGCFVGVGGALYAPDGKFYPCERFNSDSDKIGRFELYDAVTDTLNLDNINYLKQPKISNPNEFPKCKKCELYQFCNSGCTYSQMLNSKNKNLDYSEPINSVCKLLKMCYREAFRVYRELKDYKIDDVLANMMNSNG